VEAGSSGPPWLTITIAGLSFVGVVITALIGPIIVDRRRSGWAGPESAVPAMIAQRADEAVALIQHEITDLQNRVGRLETLQMAGAHGQH
jgi:hypothetical protein